MQVAVDVIYQPSMELFKKMIPYTKKKCLAPHKKKANGNVRFMRTMQPTKCLLLRVLKNHRISSFIDFIYYYYVS
jgi:hypothetical protein